MQLEELQSIVLTDLHICTGTKKWMRQQKVSCEVCFFEKLYLGMGKECLVLGRFWKSFDLYITHQQ